MATDIDICNVALQKLGAGRITSLSDNTAAARACAVSYPHCVEAELRANPWRFAIKRASLAEDAVAPDWGKASSYTLPSDFLKILRPYPEDNSLEIDYEIEGKKIYSDLSSPLNIRYVAFITDTSLMDALFRDAVACRMALQMCEALTQSNTKKAAISAEYKDSISVAKKSNAFDSIPQQPPEDSWLSVRR